jgi:dGTP triphosphohydrolase
VADQRQLGEVATKRIDQEGLHRTVCDYVAGMTDRYLMEEYVRITGERDSLQQVGAVHPNRPAD